MSIEVAQMDAVGRLGVAIKRIGILRGMLIECRDDLAADADSDASSTDQRLRARDLVAKIDVALEETAG